MTPDYKKVLLLIESSRTFGRELLYGIVRYSRNIGGWSFYRETSGIKPPVPLTLNTDADGMIVRDSMLEGSLTETKIPTIIVLHEQGRVNNIPVVIADNRIIAGLAGEHLLSKGLKNFAFCGFSNYSWSNERQFYFSEFIKSAGYKTDIYENPHTKNPDSWYKEFTDIQEWLKSLPKPVGLMACNDDRGQHILEACKVLGIKIPEEISVIGVDNDSIICELGEPPLTSIALNTEIAGFAAAALLDRLMKGEKMSGQRIIVNGTHVVQRQSTDVLAINDENVKCALRYIRQNAKNKIKVDDVVEQTVLSRRSLENHFRNTIHRSIVEEIRRIRVESISRMLVETNLTISEITEIFNFTDIEHISRYFKQEKGMGLREFRKFNRSCT